MYSSHRVRNGCLGISNPCHEATKEYAASIQVTGPLVHQIESQMHELPDQSDVQALKRKARQEKNEIAKEKADLIINSVSPKSKRMLDLASEKGASAWLQVLPISDMGFNLNKREFKQPRKPGSFTSARRYSKDPGSLWSRELLKIRATRGPRGGC